LDASIGELVRLRNSVVALRDGIGKLPANWRALSTIAV
jgi:hypothetical protein